MTHQGCDLNKYSLPTSGRGGVEIRTKSDGAKGSRKIFGIKSIRNYSGFREVVRKSVKKLFLNFSTIE